MMAGDTYVIAEVLSGVSVLSTLWVLTALPKFRSSQSGRLTNVREERRESDGGPTYDEYPEPTDPAMFQLRDAPPEPDPLSVILTQNERRSMLPQGKQLSDVNVERLRAASAVFCGR